MKELLESWNKYIIAEGGLSRNWSHMQEHDCALISAERNSYTYKENLARGHELEAFIMDAGYGYKTERGSFIENFKTPQAVEVSEKSLFVVNLQDDPGFFDHIAQLSEEFEQDSVLMIPKGGKGAYLLGTHPDNTFPPYGETITVGDFRGGVEDEFMTRTGGRPYVFKDKDIKEELQTYKKLSRNQRWAVKKMVERLKHSSRKNK